MNVHFYLNAAIAQFVHLKNKLKAKYNKKTRLASTSVVFSNIRIARKPRFN